MIRPLIPDADVTDIGCPGRGRMTWLSETANEHVPGCRLPSFVSLMNNTPFKE
jgi:hypothetical protein